jgi:hypothetical protein
MFDFLLITSLIGVAVAVSLLAYSKWPIPIEHLLISWAATGGTYLLLSLFGVDLLWRALGSYSIGTGYYFWATMQDK